MTDGIKENGSNDHSRLVRLIYIPTWSHLGRKQGRSEGKSYFKTIKQFNVFDLVQIQGPPQLMEDDNKLTLIDNPRPICCGVHKSRASSLSLINSAQHVQLVAPPPSW